MDQNEARNSDLSSAAIAEIKKPKKTWFIERTNDYEIKGEHYIFAAHEAEAWEIFNNRTNWMRRDFRIIGVSDGTTYVRIIAEAGGKAQKVLEEIAVLERQLKGYRGTEERMILTDLVDLKDKSPETKPERDKLIKLQRIINSLLDDIEVKNKEYSAYTKNVAKTAFDEELKAARGHIERPRNHNIITPNASPQERKKILKSMAGE